MPYALAMDLGPKDIPTALIHLYRGELGRMIVYRTRLDATTNWAVGSSAALTTFALGQSRAPHFVFLLVVFLDLIFLWMEARRFRFYELVRRRVRLLETGFYGEVLTGEARSGWRKELHQSLETPHAPLSLLQAASVRLRRNYLWLFVAVYLGWWLKLWLEGSGGVMQAAAMGSVPGVVVLAAAFSLLITLVVISRLHHIEEQE